MREIPELSAGFSKKDFTFFTLLAGLLLLAGGILFLRSEYKITGIGMVYAAEEWYVYSPTEERLESIAIEIGQAVQEQDVLFEMDNTDIRLEILRRGDELFRTQADLDDLQWEIRLNTIRPSDPQIVMAEERLKILDQIQQIQTAMTDSLGSLTEQRAIRSLELYRQQIDNLRTRLDTLQTRWARQWQEEGLLEVEQERLLSRKRQLEDRCRHLQQEVELLESRLQTLSIRAPISGTIADIYYRHTGMKVIKGDRMAKIIRDNGRYRVRAYLDQRNYDLVSIGMPVRMESEVFSSILEGYITGTVARVGMDIVRNPNMDTGENPSDANVIPRYEVWIDVEKSPYPLIPGSTVQVHVLMGKVPLWRSVLQLPEQRRVSSPPSRN